MNNLPFSEFLSHVPLYQYLPAPDRFYTSAGSITAAAIFGAGCGLAGRIIYPNAGISPYHYSIWFTVAFEIRYGIRLVEDQVDQFIAEKAYHELENVRESDLDFPDHIRMQCWKMIHFKNIALKAIDDVLSRVLHIRPYSEVKADNVSDASFTEMCRYRIWRVFKATILDSICSALAYQLTNGMGFNLPSRTSVPLFIIMRSLVKDILLIPSLHLYARFCNEIAEDFVGIDRKEARNRADWLNRILPEL